MSRPLFRIALISASAVLVIAACGGSGSQDLSGAPEADFYELVSVSEDGQERALVGSAPVTLTFIDEGISVQPGCNTLIASATIADGRLQVDGEIASTKKACEEPLMAQDAFFAQFLSSSPLISFEGSTMMTTSEDVVVTWQATSSNPE